MEKYDHHKDWFFEGQISTKLVNHFRNNGYEILKDNSENVKAKGEDIIVIKNGRKEIIEVKGYPSEYYTSGPKKGQIKKTKPKHQAKHWFSESILSSLFNYNNHKGKGDFIIALAFPLFERYKELIDKIDDFFTDFNLDIKIYFVVEDGKVTIDNLNKNKKNDRALGI